MGTTISNLDAGLRSELSSVFGRRLLSNVYRQLILSVITELWVEYLTQMEALRVSIGLEAYAQRDPLVQYKSKAVELFHTLQSNIRLGVISRMFTHKPRNLSSAQAQLLQLEETQDAISDLVEESQEPQQLAIASQQESPGESSPSQKSNDGGRRKRRRRR